jgi:hypothetical protein
MKNVVKSYEKRFLTFYFGSYEFPQKYMSTKILVFQFIKLFSKRLFVFLLFLLDLRNILIKLFRSLNYITLYYECDEHPITVSEDLTGDENFTKMLVDEIEQDEFELEDERMDSYSIISDTSIDSTMTDILSDNDEMSKKSDESSSEVEEEEAITNKKSNKRKLAKIEDVIIKSNKRPLTEISNINNNPIQYGFN